MNTAVAIVAADASGKAIPNVIAYLRSPSISGGFLFAITNNDGYAIWPSVPVPFSGRLQLAGSVMAYGPNGNGEAVSIAAVNNVTIRVGPTPTNPQDVQLPPCVAVSFKKPFQVAPRYWKGQMCGVRIPGLPAVEGGANDPSLFLSWFYDRYDEPTRARIRADMKAKGYTHWLLSWPDSRAMGTSINGFRALCDELIADGLYPCVFLCSKDFDPADVTSIVVGLAPVLNALVGVVPMFSIGWELSLWLDPGQVQQLIDNISPRCLQQAGTLVYVHFGEGAMSWQQDGSNVASFWVTNIGKLTGCLHQRVLRYPDPNNPSRTLPATKEQYYHESGGLIDCLSRMAGNFFMPTDSGFGHPFDLVALEITASNQFNDGMSEAEGNSWGQWAIACPAQSGPAGTVSVMGSGNGA